MNGSRDHSHSRALPFVLALPSYSPRQVNLTARSITHAVSVQVTRQRLFPDEAGVEDLADLADPNDISEEHFMLPGE